MSRGRPMPASGHDPEPDLTRRDRPAFEAAGVGFIDPGFGMGPGVRLREEE